ncbi:MAG: transcription elongation factor GreA [Minisyncoccia bacterium]
MKEEGIFLTKDKLSEFKAEHEFLTRTKRKEIAEALEYAKALGDLSENAEYHEARGEQASIEDRIAKLEQIIKSAVIIENHNTKEVSIGSTIKVRKEGDKEKKTFIIVSPEESDPKTGKISVKSPVGQATLGKKKGDEFSIKTPGGEVTYEILSIE